MQIPSSFTLLGRRINVIFDNDKMDKLGFLGQADPDFNKIYLANKHKEEILPKEVIAHNFCHEAVHHILSLMGEEKLTANEKFVDLLGGLIHQMLITSKYDDSQD